MAVMRSSLSGFTSQFISHLFVGQCTLATLESAKHIMRVKV